MGKPTGSDENPAIVGWSVFKSDKGRFWASRHRPYEPAAEKAGAWRTVDGDDLAQVCMAIAEQEALATVATGW
ncbi:hypothetical protein AB0B89_06170 [Sphaerisporangium sp. NPDC049002]|uniref:hypothetical protein n=1 Tax=unclassified Sphaerisporangium TaxID=2630420 RepID=UPI0033C8E9E7